MRYSNIKNGVPVTGKAFQIATHTTRLTLSKQQTYIFPLKNFVGTTSEI